MDRDLGMPKKSQESTPTCARVAHMPAGLPMKQICQRLPGFSTRNAASSKAHDKDATFNKEFYR
jgi:hypothetical protein